MHLKLYRHLLPACFLITVAVSAHAQSPVIISKDLRLPNDTAISRMLINSLNGFLAQITQPAKDNKYVAHEYLPETSILLDELKGIEPNTSLKNDHFYKPYLTNITELNNGEFVLQLAYMGVNAGTPLLRSSYRLMARKQGDGYCFYSPMQRQTLTWKTKKMGYITCYYKDTLNLAEIKSYQKTLDLYASKLKTPDWPVKLYYCDNLPEVLQLLGVDYVADYNGVKSIDRTTHENNTYLVLNGGYYPGQRFDTHDLFHERLRLVMKPEIINRPVDEGCAYLYGGSWGYTWVEIKARFKKYLDANPNPDWLPLYTTVANFEDGQRPLKVNYVLNALIAQKLEKEKGFAAVLELLGCGKREPDDANYFRALEKLAGINKANFNARMTELVKAERF
ncbi:MAG: hypothetical protein V4592_06455 [Bacteroidota bacterium]